MALAYGFCSSPSYTPGACSPPSHMLRGPFFLGFGVGRDYEEYAPSSPSPLGSSKDYYTPSSHLPSPDYTPSSHLPSPDYTPASPDYTPAKPDYTPASPDYTPASPDYSPASPDYTPASPDYTPSSPWPSLEYTPSSPAQLAFMVMSPPRAASPDYTPASPDYTPASPDYTPANPDYSPASPDYTPASPDYTPASPDYTPSSPWPSLEYTPSSPVRLDFMMMSPPRAASPDYTPLTPSEHASSPDYTPSTPPSSPLVVSDAESSTSAPRRRHHPYQRSGAGRINRGGRQLQRALGY
ncbi:hypothetical protein ZWY2020_007605 [Hordeum vulgare]|nr:hypothetical protein ZWY2020_007605 [Hordeum vulgare]